MLKIVRLDQTGAAGVLRVEDAVRVAPKSGEVWLEHEAIGVNYLDVMQRSGSAPLPLPNTLGLEGSGRVVEVGADVNNVAVGDRVGYILGPIGAYASGRTYPANRLIKLPDSVGFDEAAAVLFKGITAQYLIKSTYPVRSGSVIMVYGAAGGVGRVLVAWAKHLGATVIGVVSADATVATAREAGCDEVFVWAQDLAERVIEATSGRKVDVVYDGVGRTTFAASIESLRPRGMLVSIGASSGPPPAVEFATLNTKGSLYVTRPGLAAHATDIDEYRERAADVLEALANGIIRPAISRKFPLSDVVLAHEALEAGGSSGSILLGP